MEKIVCALWADPAESRDKYADRLRAALPAALHAAGASSIRLNLRDAHAEPAAPLAHRWQSPQPAAVVQFWMPSANARFRESVDAALAAHSHRFEAWLVAESTIIANRDHPPVPGERTWGWSQASFISFRSDMTRDDAIAHWHSHHTEVAIQTQSNFEYVQNLIVRPLTTGAPDYDAFVEECFPPEAMTDPYCFFDAVGDPERFDRNTQRMADSCAAFIDFARIDVMPTSQFDSGS